MAYKALHDFSSTSVFNIILHYTSLSTMTSILIDFLSFFLSFCTSNIFCLRTFAVANPYAYSTLPPMFARLSSHSDLSSNVTSLWKPFLVISSKVATHLITFNDIILLYFYLHSIYHYMNLSYLVTCLFSLPFMC